VKVSLAGTIIRAALAAALALASIESSFAQGAYPGSGAQPVTRGGTGRAALTANALVFGNGTGPVGFLIPGTGVAAALGNPLNAAGGLVGFGGALGTPTSGTGTNLTGIPISTALTGFGTGVLSALGTAIGSAGAPILFNGAGGTPSSLTLTNATGLPVSGIGGLGTGIATALGLNVGSAGAPILFNGAGGTPSSLTLTNATGLPTTGLTGALQSAQEPAHTGDVTNTAGSLALTIAANAVTNAKLATMLPWTFKANATSGSATPTDITIDGQTLKASPASGDEILIWDVSAVAIKKTTVSALASAGSVGSLNGQTGTLTIPGAGASASNVYTPLSGFINKLRNSSLTSWFHSAAALTITTSGGWGAEGIYIVPTGANIASQQVTNGLSNPMTFWAQKITGNTSNTDITVRFVIESFDAAPLAGQQVTCQFPVLNNTGGSITPTITVKRANAQDATYTNTDVSAASLQTVANGATGTLAYSWAANASSFNGLSVDIDFGNNFSANTKSIQIGGGFDCRATPGVSTGMVSSPPTPEIRPAADDIVWNERFYEASYDNGTVPGTATAAGLALAGVGYSTGLAVADGGVIRFRTIKRVAPTMSYWSASGTANTLSTVSGGSAADHCAVSAFPGGIGTRSVIFQSGCNSGISGTNIAAHYTADATLTGG
jgi:hypothetical protein